MDQEERTKNFDLASYPQLSLKPKAKQFGLAGPALRKIKFLHPGYPDNENVLLIFPAFDSGGVHHGTARVACSILVDCRWEGYFLTTRNGPAIDLDVDGILTNPFYFFCIAGDTDYAITPSFDHFRFPETLPEFWRQTPIPSTSSVSVRERDQTCRISGSSLPNELAHIIPVSQAEWWLRNTMYMHKLREEYSTDTNCPENAILLRKDLHTLWDAHKFAIVPKQNKWVVHVLLSHTTVELQEQFHNLETQCIMGVAPQFLLARFALAILTDKLIFVKQGYPRKLNIKLADGTIKPKLLSGDECRSLFNSRSKSRSESPRKRQRPVECEDNDPEQESWDSECWSRPGKRRRSSSPARTYRHEDSSDQEEEHRGRSRKRQYAIPDSGKASTASSPASIPSSAQTSIGDGIAINPTHSGDSGQEFDLLATTGQIIRSTMVHCDRVQVAESLPHS